MNHLVSLFKKLVLTSPRGFRRLFGERFFDDLCPEFLWLEATDACPNQCAFCDIGGKTPSGHSLSPDELARVLGDPIFDQLRVIVVSGGEPTVRKDLEEILAAIHRVHPRAYVVLSSSAVLPERLLAAVRSALARGTHLEVGVSLDGLGDQHDQVRGMPGLFAKVDRTLRELAALRELHPRRLNVKVGFVLSDATVSELDAVRDYVTALGLELNVQWYNQAAYYGNVGLDLLTRGAELAQAARSLPPSRLHELGQRVLSGKALEYRCSTLHNACVLKSNGDVVPCFTHWNETAGNVREETPSAIWRSVKARKTRELVRACRGCLNSCGVIWSGEANVLGRLAFRLRHLRPPRLPFAKRPVRRTGSLPPTDVALVPAARLARRRT